MIVRRETQSTATARVSGERAGRRDVTVTRFTHSQLCEIARRWLATKGRCPIVLVEFVTFLSEIPDAIGFRASGNESLLIECKASRADFLRDKKKRHRKADGRGLGTFRYYLCEPHVINVGDLPQGWGLLWASGRSVEYVAGPDPRRWYPQDDPWRWPASTREPALMYSALTRLKLALGATEFQEKVQTTFPRQPVHPAAPSKAKAWLESTFGQAQAPSGDTS